MLLDISISIFEFYIFFTFNKTIFYRKESLGNKKNMWYLSAAMAFTFYITGIFLIRHIYCASSVVLMLFSLAFLIYLSYMFQSKIKDRIFYSIILILLGIGSEMFVGFFIVGFMNGILPSIASVDRDYIFGTLCSKLFFFIASRFLSIICRKDKETIPLTYWIILVSVPIVSIFELHAVVLCATDPFLLTGSKALLVVPGILVVNILVFVIYDIVSNQYERSIQRERVLTFLENTQRRNETLVRHGLEMAALIHDSKKHLGVVYMLVKNNENNKCLDYLNELGVRYSEAIAYEKILPDNQAISIILDTKRKEARSLGIDVDYQIRINQKIPLNDTDLCMIFVNAFDNAIKACTEYTGCKKISLEIYQTYNRLVIQIKNTSMPVNIEADGLCKTTKRDILKHGFGLKNIRSIVKSFGGNMQLICENGLFTLKILFFF